MNGCGAGGDPIPPAPGDEVSLGAGQRLELRGGRAYVMAVEKLVGLDVPARAQALRVLLTELQRIASHLVWLGTFRLDLAAMSMFLYCFREREYVLDIFELVSGQRMMATYFRPGGVWRDVPVEFEAAVRDFIKTFPKRLDEYEDLLTRNPFILDRLLGIGKLTKEKALSFGVTGPILRASKLIPQLAVPRRIGYAEIREGLWLTAWGATRDLQVEPVEHHEAAARALVTGLHQPVRAQHDVTRLIPHRRNPLPASSRPSLQPWRRMASTGSSVAARHAG